MKGAAGVVAILLLILLPACGSDRGLYSWGPYEDSVYALCQDFSDEDLLQNIDDLEGHLAAQRENDRPAAPGMHAHVGYLQYLAGNEDAAARHFMAEKTLYPESTVFIDGMLRRMARG